MNQNNLKHGEFTARLNSLNLWFKISGQGPPCILPTPGWGPSSELYFLSLTPLEDHLTMIYLDTRGSGRSQKPERSTDYALADFSADIEALRQHLGLQRVWIMGHSRGGIHALHYALHHPTACIGLLLLDSIAEYDEYWLTDMHARMDRRRNEPWYERARQAYDERTLPQDDAAFARKLGEFLEFYFYDLTNMQRAAAVFSATSFSVAAWKGQQDSIPGQYGLLERLSGIDLPTLIVVGEDDFICSPLQAERIYQRIAGSRLQILPQAGHFPWLEQPEAFFAAVFEFLAEAGAL
jgi:proline iminopeptidase